MGESEVGGAAGGPVVVDLGAQDGEDLIEMGVVALLEPVLEGGNQKIGGRT